MDVLRPNPVEFEEAAARSTTSESLATLVASYENASASMRDVQETMATQLATVKQTEQVVAQQLAGKTDAQQAAQFAGVAKGSTAGKPQVRHSPY